MANTEGVNVVISGDNSKLLRSVEESKTALAGMLSFNIGDKLSQGFGSILSSLAGVLQRVAGAVSSTMKSALAIGGGFEAQITNVKVISGATEQELDMLIKKAREMGATLPITAKDAATAMTLLAQRGTSAKDILASVADVANLTISQGIDMGTAADLLGSTMTNFGIEIDNAARVTAIFNNACNQSALSMPKLVEAMKYVGPAAGAVGMELTEAVSAMEAITNAGLTGEMTGTGMAMVMSKLAATTHIMGVRTKELDGSMRPLKDIFTELKNEGFSLSDAITAFGQRGSKAALALAKNSESLAVNEERLKNWSSTQTAVNEKAKTFTNTMAALRSAVEELHIEIFEQIKNQSKEAVGGVAELTRSFSKWVGETQIAGKSLNAFIEGLGFKIPSGTGFEALLKQFNVQSFVDKVKNFGATLKSIGESIVGFFDKIKTPLTWLINNLDKFALVSFWGWILGKGLQIPAAIMSIATAFLQLYSALKKLTTLSLAGLTTLLASPAGLIGAGVAASVGVGVYAANKISAANAELKKAIEEEKRYLAEQAKADVQLPIDIQFDIKTGFEKLPESWTKASDEVRAKADADIKEIRDKFRNNGSEAVLAVMAKFPEMADSFSDATGKIGIISDDMLRKMSDALHGNEEAFKALPEPIQRVTEHLNAMSIAAGEGGAELIGRFAKYRQVKQELEKPLKKPETQSFFEELASGIYGITTSLSAEIERAQTFLSGSDGQLAVNVSVTQAQKKLEQFAKTAADKYAIPEDIVKASVIDKLSVLAAKGNDVAESLANGFSGAGLSLEMFLTNAQEAINYLGASPDKFMPALNQMMTGIQRIDPLTGKLTEKFKKAHDAMKQWANTSFDQLTSRVQKLRRAVEGGFIDQSALEAELKRVMPQLKLQVVNELQPQREQYRLERDYQAVVASELISRLNDMFGEVGMNMARDMFNGKTGADMGRAIVAEVERGFSGSSGTFKLNGIDQLQQSISSLPQNISNAMQPCISKLEQLNSSQNSKQSLPTVRDYSSVLASIIKEIQTSSNANVSAVNNVVTAVNAVKTVVETQNKNTTVVVDQNGITQAVTTGVNPLLGALQAMSANLASIQNTAQAGVTAVNGVTSAVNAVENAVKSQEMTANIDESSISNAVDPLTSAVQNLSTVLNTIQALHQANSNAINDVLTAVNSLETAIKAMNTGNTFDIDINQEGFTIGKKSDADILARATANALRAGIGNGGL